MPRAYKAIAEYYDAENAHHEMLEQDVPFLLSHLPRRRQRILEPATGTGRAAIPLAQAGHRVVGVDYDADMIALAERKRAAVGLRERELSLLRADVLKLDLGETFDWVCVLFNTFLVFATLEQQDAFLETVRRHLRPRGRFWLDIFQPNLSILAQEEARDVDPCTFYVPSLNRTVSKVTDVRRDQSTQTQDVTFRYTWFDGRGRERNERVRFTLASVFPRELRLLLERHGLKIDRMYGDYDGSKLTADSPRMIVMCSLA